MTRGGNRKGSGRKPAKDPKRQVCLYIEESKIKGMGGIEEAKEKFYKYADRFRTKN